MSEQAPERVPFADAERFELQGEDGGDQVWVVLAISEFEGIQYALLAPESELGGGDGDMEVSVFEYHRGDDGSELKELTDEALYERVYRHMADLV